MRRTRSTDHATAGAARAGLRSAAFACLALALAACSLDIGAIEASGTPEPTPAPAVRPAAATLPVPISPGDRSKLTRPAVRPAADRRTPRQREEDVRALIGKDEGAVLSSLGEPALREEEPPARVWHYGTRGCAVDLVFFFDMSSGEHRLALFRPAGAKPAKVDEVGCLARAMAEKGARS